MALGKAFIEVHADTKPFARELQKELDRIVKESGSGDLKKSGVKLGESLGDGISEGVDKNKGKVRKSVKNLVPGEKETSNIFSRFSKGIIDSIDDGLSGLPAEVKVALGAALLAITPFLGASIAGVVGAALGTAFAGIGVLLAFQFQRVRLEGAGLVTFLRDLFTTAAKGFVDPVIAGIRTIETRFAALAPTLTRIFDIAAGFVEPLTDGLVGFFENLAPGLEESLGNVTDLVDILAFHLKVLGRTFGDALLIITGNDDLGVALYDFLTLVETIILTGAVLIRVLTEIYKYFRLIVGLVSPVLYLAGAFDKTGAAITRTRGPLGGFQSTLDDLVAPTDAEEKALKDVNDQLEAFTSNTAAAWHSNINFEQTLDDMSASLKKNKGELDLNKQAGRDHQSAILAAAEALQKQRSDTILLTGDTEKANITFEKNKKRLEEQAVAGGISAKKFQELTDAILAIPPTTPGPTISPASVTSVNNAIADWRELRTLINNSHAAGKDIRARPLGTYKGYANGGVFTSPTVGLFAESGPEAIIPLSNPARAQQVMAQAGLGGTGNVSVYIGNDQINAYIDKRVDTRLSMTARSMSYGVRPV